MGIRVGDVLLFVRGDTSKLGSDLDGAEKKTRTWANSVGDGVKNLIGGVIKGGALVATTAVAGLTAGFIALGKAAFDAMPLEGIRNAFRGVTSNAEEMIATLRAGALGMVSDSQLMQQYVEAYQLVGKEFADRLPEAMQYLGKVSAATGTDMNYLLGSLTTGVGRLSPAILDNLKIQVGLAEATERAAQMYGVETDALTKAQIQAGMMDLVLERLAENTAAMPDITENAATKWAQLQATWKNIVDYGGMALLPILGAILSPLATMAEKIGPKVADALNNQIGPAIQQFFSYVQGGLTPVEALRAVLTEFGGEAGGELAMKLFALSQGLQALWEKSEPVRLVFLALWNGIVQVGAGIGTALAPLLPVLWQSFERLGQALAPVVPILGVVLVGALALVVGAIEGIIVGFAAFINGLAQVVTGVIAFVTGVVTLFGGLFTTIVGLITGNSEQVQIGIQTMVDGLLGILNGLLVTGVGIFQTLVNTIIGLAAGMVDGMIGFFQGMFDTIVGHSIIPDMVNAIIDWISKLPAEFAAVGVALVQSFIGGIQSMAGAAVDAARNVVNNALEAARGALGGIVGAAVEGAGNLLGGGVSNAVSGGGLGGFGNQVTQYNLTYQGIRSFESVEQDFRFAEALAGG